MNFPESSMVLTSVNLPLDVDWHTPIRSKISVRCFNLMLANSIESCSGWAEKAFSADDIRETDGSNYHGVRKSDGIVSGLLGQSLRKELIQQWVSISKLWPDFKVSTRIKELLKNVEKSTWYQEEVSRLPDLHVVNVAAEGENDAIWLCLFFSRISLVQAQSKQDTDFYAALGHTFNALSVVLPLSQFALNERLWGSNIGIVGGFKFPSMVYTRTAAPASPPQQETLVPRRQYVPPPPPPPPPRRRTVPPASAATTATAQRAYSPD